MSELQSVPTTRDDSDKIVLKEWTLNESEVISGLWGVAKVLDQGLQEPAMDEEVRTCLTLELVNLASQLKDSLELA